MYAIVSWPNPFVCYSKFTEVCEQLPLTGTKPSTEPMTTYSNEVYMQHWEANIFIIQHKHTRDLGAVSIYRCHLTSLEIPMLKIRWSCDHLIFNMGIPIPWKMIFILRRGAGGVGGPAILHDSLYWWDRVRQTWLQYITINIYIQDGTYYVSLLQHKSHVCNA